MGALGVLWQGWLGDDETLLDGPEVDLEQEPRLIQAVAGGSHACALFEGGTLKCWGYGGDGATGYGTTETLCDEQGEEPKDLPSVDVGGKVVSVSAGARNTCVVLEHGEVKCWGHAGRGKLGLGDGTNETIGDDETPALVEPINLSGGPVVQVATQSRQICALHQDGSVSCWGEAGPWLGYGPKIDMIGSGLGDDEDPATLGVLEIGGKVVEIAVGSAFSCARLTTGEIKCWGASDLGQLGRGSTDFIGYDQTPAEVSPIVLGGKAISLTAGWDHACALLEDHTLRCWGLSSRLGYGTGENIGDDETPAQAGAVPVY